MNSMPARAERLPSVRSFAPIPTATANPTTAMMAATPAAARASTTSCTVRRERPYSPSASTTTADPIPMIADRPSMRSRSARMSTLSATPVTAARTIGRSRRLIHVQIAAANAAIPTIDHTIDPAIATDTPAIAVTAHHGAVADAHVTSPTDRMISTASGTVEPVGDASLSAAASPATAAVTSAPACRPDAGSPTCHAWRPVASPSPIGERRYRPGVGATSRRGSRKPGRRTGRTTGSGGVGGGDVRPPCDRGADPLRRPSRCRRDRAIREPHDDPPGRGRVVRRGSDLARTSCDRARGTPIRRTRGSRASRSPGSRPPTLRSRDGTSREEGGNGGRADHRRFEGGVGRLGVDRPSSIAWRNAATPRRPWPA